MTKKNIPKIISISGSIHSGKTTLSRLLAIKMPNAFYLDGDLLSSLIGSKYTKETTIDDRLPTVHATIIEFIQASLKNGADVIVDYPLDDKTRYQITDSLKNSKYQAYWFLLKPAIEKVLKGSVNRPELNEWEIKRIKYHYESPLMTTNLALVIDSTKQSPEETLAVIMEKINSLH